MRIYNKHYITTDLKDNKELNLRDAVNSFEYMVQLSPNIELRKDGYLIARNAVVGNVGKLQYSERELGWSGSDKKVNVLREAEDVFDEESLKSLEGAPITIKHPKTNVSSSNVKELQHGTVLGVPRRVGDNMVVDLAFHTEEVVDLLAPEVVDENGNVVRKLNEKFRDLSLGYKAKLVEIANNLYKQTDIIYNHLALVPQGRQMNAAIRDEKNNEIEKEVIPKMSLLDKLFKKGKRVETDPNGKIIISEKEELFLDETEEEQPEKATDETQVGKVETEHKPAKKETADGKENENKEDKDVEDNDAESKENENKDSQEENKNMKDMKYFQDELVRLNALPDSPIKVAAINKLNNEFFETFPEQKEAQAKKEFKDAIVPVKFNNEKDLTLKDEKPKLRFNEVAKFKDEYYRKLTDPFSHKNWNEFNEHFNEEMRKGRSIMSRTQ
ncbi:MAG: DUF2213 domain-containing protein [Candidatus Caldatribacteriota bacterium]|jgi:hypothetical protein|nr:DUF2213 domain-containing protein [Acholeplasmatales bacterium]